MKPTSNPWDEVTVVIVTHNSQEVISPCLESVRSAKRVVLVDNASDDATCREAKRVLPGISIIRNKFNRGFGAAVNQGMVEVKTAYGFCFSPDAVLVDNAMEQLVSTANSNPNVAMLGPFLQNTKGEQRLYVMGPGEITHSPLPGKPDGEFCTWFIMGGFFLARMCAWREMGGFDEQIFLYNEDVDLCLRATKAGRCLMIVPDAVVIHAGGQSSAVTWRVRWRKDWHQTWSRLYLMTKHGNPAKARRSAREIFFRQGLKTLLYGLLLRPDRVRGNFAKAGAAVTFLLGHPAR